MPPTKGFHFRPSQQPENTSKDHQSQAEEGNAARPMELTVQDPWVDVGPQQRERDHAKGVLENRNRDDGEHEGGSAPRSSQADMGCQDSSDEERDAGPNPGAFSGNHHTQAGQLKDKVIPHKRQADEKKKAVGDLCGSPLEELHNHAEKGRRDGHQEEQEKEGKARDAERAQAKQGDESPQPDNEAGQGAQREGVLVDNCFEKRSATQKEQTTKANDQ